MKISAANQAVSELRKRFYERLTALHAADKKLAQKAQIDFFEKNYASKPVKSVFDFKPYGNQCAPVLKPRIRAALEKSVKKFDSFSVHTPSGYHWLSRRHEKLVARFEAKLSDVRLDLLCQDDDRAFLIITLLANSIKDIK